MNTENGDSEAIPQVNPGIWISLTIDWCRGGSLCRQKQQTLNLSWIAINCNKTFSWELISHFFFASGFVCIESLSRGIYLWKFHLKRGTDTDKFLINSYEFNSSALLFPATHHALPGISVCWIFKRAVR